MSVNETYIIKDFKISFRFHLKTNNRDIVSGDLIGFLVKSWVKDTEKYEKFITLNCKEFYS